MRVLGAIALATAFLGLALLVGFLLATSAGVA